MSSYLSTFAKCIKSRGGVLAGGLIFICASWYLFAADMKEACKFNYTGAPEELNGQQVIVNEKFVAMAESIHVFNPVDSENIVNSPSIFFLIDHSSSMYTGSQKDRWGERFIVTQKVIDTIFGEFPKAEIGVGVFTEQLYFRKANDPTGRLTQCPGQTGSYIPLFRLDSSYAPDSKTGYTILSEWLDTAVHLYNSSQFVDLEYVPSPNWPDSGNPNTNITAGFAAAKHAMLKSSYPKDRQYILFFSDGEPFPLTMPDAWDFVAGDSVPTTFTIYFTEQSTAPESLVVMTNNIMTNGYSSKNDSSKIWAFDNINNSLLNFVMTHVFDIFTAGSVGKPKTIKINNSTNGNYDPNTNTFNFANLFPLEGVITNFNYEIVYTIRKDTVDSQGNIITIERDETSNVQFNAVVQDGAPDLPDTFDVRCWERGLGYHNTGGTEITSADERNQSIEIRFSFDPGDAGYVYTNAKVELTHFYGNPKDVETVTLTQINSTTYGFTFQRTVDSLFPVSNNGVLQHYAEDSIIAVFRNSESTPLPLDTVRIAIPFKHNGIVELDEALFYDKEWGGNTGADGYVDYIELKMKTTMPNGIKDAQLNDLKNLIVLPSGRGFTNAVYSLLDSVTIKIDVDEDMSRPPRTYTNSNDAVKINSGILLSSGGEVVTEKTVTATDKVAPVIRWEDSNPTTITQYSAILKKYVGDITRKDTLYVNFSENIKKIKNVGAQAIFIYKAKGTNQNYSANLTLNTTADTASTMEFTVDSIFNGADSISSGDSIWISFASDRVSDVVSNFQRTDNIHRRIFVDTTIIEKDIDITVVINAITPFDISDPNNIDPIPNDVQIIIDNSNINIINSWNLDKINGKYQGMIIQIKPDSSYILDDVNLRLEGTIDIFDAVGNRLVEDLDMIYVPQWKSLLFIWNAKNKNSRYVGSGSYLAVASYKIIVNNKVKVEEQKRKLVSVKK